MLDALTDGKPHEEDAVLGITYRAAARTLALRNEQILHEREIYKERK